MRTYTAVLYNYFGGSLGQKLLPGETPRAGDVIFLKSKPNSEGPGARYKVTVVERVFQEQQDGRFKESGLRVHMQMITEDKFKDSCREEKKK